ncbi:rod shape-determining protein MreD [Sphingomonas sabuli]|uniref:Rod shape-determining protein MreD n=1 Tax=Sphingomonas sabuli TaxID=2764186 RepID=A0A7G9L3U2_9SPHN|nr:rod shape-determining protein MreD [Sphingomonas sabuli]QNM83291.1 rod shape-determining protein MreD [Sphingomonas sabuli]
MPRSALASRRRIGQGPIPLAEYFPAVSVLVASLLAVLPIVTQTGWFPSFGFLLLIAWRLYRNDVWPSWWAAPLGLFNDLVTGAPIGLSVTVWTMAMLALDLLDRRTIWRDYWVEWALAAVLILFNESAEWQVAAWMRGGVPFASMVPPILISIAAFPIAAWVVAKLDQWRLGSP